MLGWGLQARQRRSGGQALHAIEYLRHLVAARPQFFAAAAGESADRSNEDHVLHHHTLGNGI
jgi:hypothetical protein